MSMAIGIVTDLIGLAIAVTVVIYSIKAEVKKLQTDVTWLKQMVQGFAQSGISLGEKLIKHDKKLHSLRKDVDMIIGIIRKQQMQDKK